MRVLKKNYKPVRVLYAIAYVIFIVTTSLKEIKLVNVNYKLYFSVGSGDTSPLNNGCLRPPLHELKDSPGVKRRSRHVARLNMGEAKDDIHVCILCMRAIMNNKVRNKRYKNYVQSYKFFFFLFLFYFTPFLLHASFNNLI